MHTDPVLGLLYARARLRLLLAQRRFSLDKDTGLIMLIAKLDYELIQRFTLTVIARDGGGEETTGRVRINVLDVNDNVPTFQKDAYVGALRENEPSVTQLVRLRVRCQPPSHSSPCPRQPTAIHLTLLPLFFLTTPLGSRCKNGQPPIREEVYPDLGVTSLVWVGLPLSITSCLWLPRAASVCLSSMSVCDISGHHSAKGHPPPLPWHVLSSFLCKGPHPSP